MEQQIYLFAKRGVLAEIDDWKEKRKAVEALGNILTEAEIGNMLNGIDRSIAELMKWKEEIEKSIRD